MFWLVAGLDGRVRGVMGASGGPRIISSVLTTAFRWRPDLPPHPCARPALLPVMPLWVLRNTLEDTLHSRFVPSCQRKLCQMC